jgi:hypothetical protein
MQLNTIIRLLQVRYGDDNDLQKIYDKPLVHWWTPGIYTWEGRTPPAASYPAGGQFLRVITGGPAHSRPASPQLLSVLYAHPPWNECMLRWHLADRIYL